MHWDASMKIKDGVMEYSGSISEAESIGYKINWMVKFFIQISQQPPV